MSHNPENEMVVVSWGHPKCPYCDYVDSAIDASCVEDFDSIECSSCGKSYHVAVSTEFVCSGDWRERLN